MSSFRGLLATFPISAPADGQCVACFTECDQLGCCCWSFNRFFHLAISWILLQWEVQNVAIFFWLAVSLVCLRLHLMMCRTSWGYVRSRDMCLGGWDRFHWDSCYVSCTILNIVVLTWHASHGEGQFLLQLLVVWTAGTCSITFNRTFVEFDRRW